MVVIIALFLLLVGIVAMSAFSYKSKAEDKRNGAADSTGTNTTITQDAMYDTETESIGNIGEKEAADKIDSAVSKLNLGNSFHGNYFKLPKKNIPFQIDHLIVTRKGIIVVETKYWAGHIRGDDKHEKWIVYPNGWGYKQKKYYYSPVKQNQTHINRMRELFGSNSKIPFISLILFVGHNVSLDIKSDRHNIMQLGELDGFLTRIGKSPDVLSSNDISRISQFINRSRITSEDFVKFQKSFAINSKRINR